MIDFRNKRLLVADSGRDSKNETMILSANAGAGRDVSGSLQFTLKKRCYLTHSGGKDSVNEKNSRDNLLKFGSELSVNALIHGFWAILHRLP